MGLILSTIQKNHRAGRKSLAILIGRYNADRLGDLDSVIRYPPLDYLMASSTILLKDGLFKTARFLNEEKDLPVILFPGSTFQFCKSVVELLFMSLISCRNADLLIGKQIKTGPRIKSAGGEAISAGYMLIDGSNSTGASNLGHTQTIPREKANTTAATGIAAEKLCMHLFYLNAGSDAKEHVPFDMIRKLRKNVSVPIVIGGGIRSPEGAAGILKNRTDIIAVGTGTEVDASPILEISQAVHEEKWIAG